MRKEIRLKAIGCTDIGKIRSVNEDCYKIDFNIFIIADGMGGHIGGEIASEITVASITKYLNNNLLKKGQSNENTIKQIIHQAIYHANQIIYDYTLDHINYKGMGTTVVLGVFEPPYTMHIANVGDSRAYVLRSKELTMITKDHSVVASMLREKIISKNEVHQHSFRGYLTQSIGTKTEIEIFYKKIILQENDIILLCSDGLWNMVSNQEIVKNLTSDKNIKLKCNNLIKKANEHGGKDNITVIIINTL